MAINTASINSKNEVAIDCLDTIQYQLSEMNAQLDALAVLHLVDASNANDADNAIAELRNVVAKM